MLLQQKFSSDEEQDIFEEILSKLQTDKPEKMSVILDALYEKYPKEKVYNVVNELNEFDLLEDESIYEVYASNLGPQLSFWSLNAGAPNALTAKETQERIRTTNLAVLGSGVSQQLIADKAKISGFENVLQVSISEKTDEAEVRSIIENCDFFIYDADEWNPHFLELVNKTAFEFDKPWILFNGIVDLKASVGPLFKGRETGCYNCLMSRIKSNMEFIPYFNEFEKHLADNKKSGARQGAPIVLYDMAASICIMEALKYITEWAIPILYKNFITINAMGLEVKVHPFLKAPVCDVCTPNIEFNPAPWLEPVTLKN
jgi:bacteriocin biosynthesis cyclodehydratase domain-containing protein